MKNRELEAELEELPQEEKEYTETLLRLAHSYASSRKTFEHKAKEINKRAKEKNISFNQARAELRKETRELQKKSVANDRKLLKPKLSKTVRKQLGIKPLGRPKGSKKTNIKYSKAQLESKLSNFIRSYYEENDVEPTQEVAAIALGLRYAKKLKRLLAGYGEGRDWRNLVSDKLARGK